MTKVDYKQFPPQQALRKVNGQANGNCFFGFCAVCQGENGVVALIAPDVDTLELAWDDISTFPLNRDGVQMVAIFSQESVTPNSVANRRTADNRRTKR